MIDLGRRSPLSKARRLEELGIPRSTYFRWQGRYRQPGEVGWVDRRSPPGAAWNRLTPQAEETILREALRQPELSSRAWAGGVTDPAGFAVSASRVYRRLQRPGLIREVQVRGLPAGQEYPVQTRRRHEPWPSEASSFFGVGWGWYYLIAVRNDDARYLRAGDLKLDLTAESIREVVPQAVEWRGMQPVPREDRPRLLSDRGPG